MPTTIVEGNLLDQDVEAIVNAWNRNTIPWWLLLPQGVSGAIKRRGGTAPFRELAKSGRMSLGQAVATSAGRLPFRAIIHVAGIDDFWRGSEPTTRLCVRNAIALAVSSGYRSIAFPLLGAGSGGLSPKVAEQVMLDELAQAPADLEVVLVRYNPSLTP